VRAWALRAAALKVEQAVGASWATVLRASRAVGREGAGQRAGKGEGRSGPPSGGPVCRKEGKEGGKGLGRPKPVLGWFRGWAKKGRKEYFSNKNPFLFLNSIS